MGNPYVLVIDNSTHDRFSIIIYLDDWTPLTSGALIKQRSSSLRASFQFAIMSILWQTINNIQGHDMLIIYCDSRKSSLPSYIIDIFDNYMTGYQSKYIRDRDNASIVLMIKSSMLIDVTLSHYCRALWGAF